MDSLAIRSLILFVSISFGAGLIAACVKANVIAETEVPTKSEPPSSEPAKELTLLEFTNYVVDVTAEAEYLSPSVFDPVMLYGVAHGQSKAETSFQLEGQPTHPKPMEIVLLGSGSGTEFSRTITASAGHFIASVDTTWGPDRETVTVIALHEDGTPASVK